jgi:hypothetical protein
MVSALDTSAFHEFQQRWGQPSLPFHSTSRIHTHRPSCSFRDPGCAASRSFFAIFRHAISPLLEAPGPSRRGTSTRRTKREVHALHCSLQYFDAHTADPGDLSPSSYRTGTATTRKYITPQFVNPGIESDHRTAGLASQLPSQSRLVNCYYFLMNCAREIKLRTHYSIQQEN